MIGLNLMGMGLILKHLALADIVRLPNIWHQRIFVQQMYFFENLKKENFWQSQDILNVYIFITAWLILPFFVP